MEEDDLISVLVDPLDICTLEAGTEFRVDPLESDIEMSAKELPSFRLEESSAFNEVYFSVGTDDQGNDRRGNPGVDSFDSFASKMTNITDSGSVKKLILRNGQQGSSVPDDAYVEVHYNAYLEYGNSPYDSTFLSGKSSKFSLLDCIEGLAIAVRTMRKKERAQILLQADVAYKAQGIPPRIPANAEILYEIELIDFEMGVDEATGLNTRQSKREFKNILADCRAKLKEANNCFEKKDLRGALMRYNKAMNMLERCNLANKEEEVEQEKVLLTLYTSLAVCLNKEKKAPQACNMCKCALKIKPDHPKALFQFGRALLTLGEFQEAKVKLMKAEKLQPNDIKIKEELKKVEVKQQEYIASQKLFAARIFSSSSSNN